METVNGKTSWNETHFEIVDEIVRRLNFDSKGETRLSKLHNQVGRGGLYELAEELTDKFELKFKDREWDGEFFDEIEEFCSFELD